MKKLGMLLAMALALVVAGCGDDDNKGGPSGGGNVCERAGLLTVNAMKDQCKNQSGCAMCTCINNSSACPVPEVPHLPGGTSVDMNNACEGQTAKIAQQCLDNPSLCKQCYGSLIPMACSSATGIDFQNMTEAEIEAWAAEMETWVEQMQKCNPLWS